MKKFLGIFIILALIFTIIVELPNQETKKTQTATPKESVTNKLTYKQNSLEEAYKNAVAGISDKGIKGVNEKLVKKPIVELEKTTDSNIKLISTKDNSSNENKDEAPVIEEYETQQILSEEENKDTGVITQEIVVTKFIDVSIDNENFENTPGNSLTKVGNKGDDAWDESKGVKAYSEFYFTNVTSNSDDRVKFTKATGGWTVADSSIALSGRTVTFGASGVPAGNQTTTKSPTANSFSYTAPSSWSAVSVDAEGAIGITTKVTLKLRSSSWTLKLTNNL